MADKPLHIQVAEQIQSGAYSAAQQALEAWLHHSPSDTLALNLLCKLADRNGDYAHAAEWLCRTLEVDPTNHRAYCFLGYVMCKLGQFEAGLECYDKAIAACADQAAYFCERAAALAQLGRDSLAVADYEKALALDPTDAHALAYLGTSLQRLGDLHRAIACFDQAISFDSQCVAAYLNRGNAHLQQQTFSRALADYDQAIALQPDHALAYANRAAALKQLHRLDESLQSSDRAIALNPQFEEARFNKSLTQLLRGDLVEGFRGYQARWQTPAFAPIKRTFHQTMWLGESHIRDKRLFVHNEQGFGDSIQFCRFVSLAARVGAQVIYEVEAPLYDLFQSLEGVHTLIRQREPIPDFDLYCPVMSLPIAFNCSLSNLPAQSHYLRPRPDKLAQWGARLGPREGPRIGLVWSGNPTHKADQQRSIALEVFLDALAPHLQYFSLQKDLRIRDQDALERAHIRHFGSDLADFSDTAALCAHMDLVIAVDTSVAHLAGALGVPTWLLLPHLPDWRWLLGREDSPWYPGVRLFRQKTAAEWGPVLGEVRQSLATLGL